LHRLFDSSGTILTNNRQNSASGCVKFSSGANLDKNTFQSRACKVLWGRERRNSRITYLNMVLLSSDKNFIIIAEITPAGRSPAVCGLPANIHTSTRGRSGRSAAAFCLSPDRSVPAPISDPSKHAMICSHSMPGRAPRAMSDFLPPEPMSHEGSKGNVFFSRVFLKPDLGRLTTEGSAEK